MRSQRGIKYYTVYTVDVIPVRIYTYTCVCVCVCAYVSLCLYIAAVATARHWDDRQMLLIYRVYILY